MTKPYDALRRSSGINGVNAEYIDQLYEAFRESPDSVSAEWRNYFYGFEHASQGVSPGARRAVSSGIISAGGGDAATGMQRLIMAYRMLGHLAADIDPLGMAQRKALPDGGLLRP